MLGLISTRAKKLISRRSKKVGLPPGTAVFTGEKKVDKVTIEVIDYDETNFQRKKVETIEECFPFKDMPTVTWININGLHEVDMLRKLGDYFGMHPLVLEDIVSTDQRPKLEDYESYLYVVLKMLKYDVESHRVSGEQISLVLGKNFVLSFQEIPGDMFNHIRDRIQNSKGRVRRMGADYLAYTLLDAIVDHYFVILEQYSERMEFLEDEVFENPAPETLQTLQHMKREMIYLRRSIWPLRDVVSRLERGESELIQSATEVYLRDLYDHTIQVIEAVETFRDMLAGVLDIYLSSVSNRMNEVMKVLTMFATIFIPLTFVAGVYGMNFEYIPELKWYWSYPIFWCINVVVGGIMLVYFRRKRWL